MAGINQQQAVTTLGMEPLMDKLGAMMSQHWEVMCQLGALLSEHWVVLSQL